MYFTVTDKFKLIKTTFNNLMGVLSANHHQSPPAIVWLLTYQCNAMCEHCDFWKRGAVVKDDNIMLMAKKIARSNTFIVNLSGGEIFLIPCIKEVIQLLKKSGKYIRINTNGLVLGDYLDFLLEIRVDSIVVSVDSIIAEKHDANRGKPGAFDKSIKAIEYIRSKRKGEKPEISVRCVVMKSNFSQIDAYIHFFSPKVDNIQFQPIHNKTDKHKVINSNVLFSAEDEPAVRDAFKKLALKYDFMDRPYFRSFPDFIFHPERLVRTSVDFCLPVLYNTLMIRPDGDCYTCSQSLGNLMRDELPTIWGATQKKDFLKNLASTGHCAVPCWLNSNSAKTTIAGRLTKCLVKIVR